MIHELDKPPYYLRKKGDSTEKKKKILALSKRYGILSSLTAFYAVCKGQDQTDWKEIKSIEAPKAEETKALPGTVRSRASAKIQEKKMKLYEKRRQMEARKEIRRRERSPVGMGIDQILSSLCASEQARDNLRESNDLEDRLARLSESENRLKSKTEEKTRMVAESEVKRAAELKKKRAKLKELKERRAKLQGAMVEEKQHQSTSKGGLHFRLIEQQLADGLWPKKSVHEEILANLDEGRLRDFSLNIPQANSEISHEDLIATIVVVALLMKKCADFEGEWSLCVRKSRKLLEKAFGDSIFESSLNQALELF